MVDDKNSVDSHKTIKLVVGAILVVTLIVAARYFNIQELLKGALEWIKNLGYWGPLTFIILYNLATVLFLPGSILTLGAGILYGVVWGSIYVSIASTLGATLAFILGRYLTRAWIEKKLEGKDNFKAIDRAVATEGWKIVFLTRLSPLFPFNLLNYAFGLTKVRLKDYFLASWVGMIPGTILYVYIGSIIGSITGLEAGIQGRERTPIEWVVYAIGLISTVILTVYVTKIAQKALETKI